MDYTGPDQEFPSRYINFHAFAAHIDERRTLSTDPTWAIWAQREAHETPHDTVHDSGTGTHVLAAAQWILWYGRTLFQQVLCPADVASDDLRDWKPGPLYDGKSGLSLERWRFWRDGFDAVASGRTKEDVKSGQECMEVAARAVGIMDALEKSMTS